MRRPYERFRCSCGEVCVMVPHAQSGKPAPITVAAYPNGNIRINLESVNAGHGTYSIVPKRERERDPRPRPLNHHADCPDRANFGGRR